MQKFDMVAKDGATVLTVTIKDNVTEDLINLTGKTVQLRYSLNQGATVQKTMTALNQTTFPGQAFYTFLTTDILQGGTLDGEVRLQAGLSDQLTTVDEFHLTVRDALP